MCAGGQGGCVTSATDCCQFYDVVTNMCINTCPAGSNTTDFICGKYTYIHLKLMHEVIIIMILFSVDPCLHLPCQNQGMCIARPTLGLNYTCNCTESFIGINCDSKYN